MAKSDIELDTGSYPQWATEATQLEIKRLLSGKGPEGARIKKEKADESKARKDTTKEYVAQSTAIKGLEKSFNNIGSIISGSTGLASQLLNINGKFASLGGIVDLLTETVSTVAESIPFFGGAVSAAAKATGELVKLQLEFMDVTKETFDSLAQSGRVTSVNFTELISNIIDTNIALETYADTVKTNALGLLAFYGTVTKVARDFTSDLAGLTNPGSEIGMALRTFGMGANEITEEFADFFTQQARTRGFSQMTETQLQKTLLERIKQERTLAEITGVSVQEQRRAQLEALADNAFRAKMIERGLDAEQVSRLTTLQGILMEQGMGEMGKQLFGINQIFGENSAILANSFPGLQDAIKQAQEAVINGTMKPAEAFGQIADFLASDEGNIQNALRLTTLGILPQGNFLAEALGETTMGIIERENILAAMNREQELQGRKTFAGVGKELDAAYNAQIETAKDAAKRYREFDDPKMSLQEFLEKETGILDKGLMDMIIRQAELEEIGTDIQRGLFDLTMGRMKGLADVTLNVTSAFGRLISTLTQGMSKEERKAYTTDMVQGVGGTADPKQFLGGMSTSYFKDDQGETVKIRNAQQYTMPTGEKLFAGMDEQGMVRYFDSKNDMKSGLGNSSYTTGREVDPMSKEFQVDLTETNRILNNLFSEFQKTNNTGKKAYTNQVFNNGSQAGGG